MGIVSDTDTPTPSGMMPPGQDWDDQPPGPSDDIPTNYGPSRDDRDRKHAYDIEGQAKAQLELFKLFERYQQEIIKLQASVASERQKRYRIQDQLESHQTQLHKLQTEYDQLKQRYELERREREVLENAFQAETYLTYGSGR